MVVEQSSPSPHSDALRGEIELLRAAVAALRATRPKLPAPAPEGPARSVMTASVVSFAAGVGVTVAGGAVAIYVLGLCG